MRSIRTIAIAACLAAAAPVAVAVVAFTQPRSATNVPATPEEPSFTRYRAAYDSPQQFMEGIYRADHAVEPPQDRRIRAAIVPHHLTAASSIASGLKMLERQDLRKIVLLSPDHFGRCETPLCTVLGRFATFFGEVSADPDTVGTLLRSPLVTGNARLFADEHGISAALPFIAQYFPGVPVTPLVLSQTVPWRPVRSDLLEVIKTAIDEDTVFVVSSDFSHYLPLAGAEANDARTVQAVFAKDLDAIERLDNPRQSDCPGCLWILASLADARGFYDPSVVAHTNSATILGEPDAARTTSHYSMVWFEGAEPEGADTASAGEATLTR